MPQSDRDTSSQPSQVVQPESLPQPPRFRRLASKPLKLAASAIHSVSRAATPAPQTAPLPYGSDSPSSIVGSGGSGAASTTSSIQGRAQNQSYAGNKLSLRRHRRHQRVRSGQGLDPALVAQAARGPRKPLEGEAPAAWLRVRVVSAEGLIAKDRGNTSDPFISLLIAPTARHTTPVVKRTLNPLFPAAQSTFDFPLYLSLAAVIGGRGLEGVVWDKDLMRKEYMGELFVGVDQWFGGGPARLWKDDLPVSKHELLSTRRRHKVSGTVSLQIGFVKPKDVDNDIALHMVHTIYESILSRALAGGQLGVLGVPAHEGIGTVKMKRINVPDLEPETKSVLAAATTALVAPILGTSKSIMDEDDKHVEDEDEDEECEDLTDDGLTSSSEDEPMEDALEGDEDGYLRESPKIIDEVESKVSQMTIEPVSAQPVALQVPDLRRPSPSPSRQSSLPSLPTYFDRPSPTPPGVVTPGGTRRRLPFRRGGKSKSSTKKDFNYDHDGGKDMLGIVVMEVQGASDLPRIKNALRVGWDMDPFVVISFGKKVFRTRVIRHSLNPTWDEKLLFHVRRHESAFTIQMAVLDWDKISGNDMVGTCTLSLSELLADAPKPDPLTGLYGKDEDGKHDSKDFTLPVITPKDTSWASRHSPQLQVRAKYEPYDALRQRFWRQFAIQYDVDETGTMSYIELSTMLDSLGSTLTHSTIEGYFASCGKSAERDELTIDEVVMCLEREVTKTRDEKRVLSAEESVLYPRTPTTIDPPSDEPVDADELAERILESHPRFSDGLPPPIEPTESIPSVTVEGTQTAESGDVSPMSVDNIDDSPEQTPSPDDRERIINIKECPMCHRSRLGKRSEQDIVTHLAICASTNWSRVDRIVTTSYVTSSQAQRKLVTKIINKVAIGAYSLGANSANILVQDRRTGQLQEEKMAVYVRVGIRVLYKGARTQMAGARARRMLKSLSIKQGEKYDSPESTADILPFISFHNLDIDEIRDPLESFKTFNQFFYRKLKADARPIEEPENASRLVSCADCRMMAFETVSEAKQIWIKGRGFTVSRLLGATYQDIASKYNGGALAIFRLAPQDYHRFHSPVRGKIGKMTLIDGEYYTVNPQAIRTSLDVYGENVRKIVPIHSEEFGTVITVWVGAMMVGSIGTSVSEGDEVLRGDELGWFAFGGSTIVCLFEHGKVEWDDDLVGNGRAAIETLVRMGTGIGRAVGSAEQ